MPLTRHSGTRLFFIVQELSWRQQKLFEEQNLDHLRDIAPLLEAQDILLHPEFAVYLDSDQGHPQIFALG